MSATKNRPPARFVAAILNGQLEAAPVVPIDLKVVLSQVTSALAIALCEDTLRFGHLLVGKLGHGGETLELARGRGLARGDLEALPPERTNAAY